MRIEDARDILQRNEEAAREMNLRGSRWLMESLEKVFKEYKT